MAKEKKNLRKFEKGSIEDKAKIKTYKKRNEKRSEQGLPVKKKEYKKLIKKYKDDDKKAGVKIKYKKTPLS